MNQLQAVAINEGLRSKKRLWRESGREQLEAFRLAPWASRRREDLLKLLDGLNPTIAELTQAIQQELVGWAHIFNESEMARSSECKEQYAQKVLDTADIVRDVRDA